MVVCQESTLATGLDDTIGNRIAVLSLAKHVYYFRLKTKDQGLIMTWTRSPQWKMTTKHTGRHLHHRRHGH